MVKKARSTKKRSYAKPKTSKRKIHKLTITQSSSELKVEKILIENFISLQGVMTKLSIKLDGLTNQISNLLELFEVSARALVAKESDLEKGDKDNEKILEKIDSLSEQNKIIAKGLTLLHEPSFGQEHQFSVKEPIQMKKPMPSLMPKQEKNLGEGMDIEEYQKSISSASENSKPLQEN